MLFITAVKKQPPAFIRPCLLSSFISLLLSLSLAFFLKWSPFVFKAERFFFYVVLARGNFSLLFFLKAFQSSFSVYRFLRPYPLSETPLSIHSLYVIMHMCAHFIEFSVWQGQEIMSCPSPACSLAVRISDRVRALEITRIQRACECRDSPSLFWQ